MYYKARGLDTPIYEQNKELQRLVNSIYKISGEEFKNIARSTGFRLLDNNDNPLLLDIDKTYKEVISRCVVAVSQGKETYQQTMRSTLKQLSDSGVRRIEYESGYSRRLDSSIRMNILDSMRQVSNESQQLFGKEFDSDGVEISVHLNPAPDHELVQGRQFSNEEFENFQNDRKAVDYTGMVFEPEFKGHDRRSISEYNCYHYIFSIVLGISKPQYSDKQLKEIIDNKNKTFEFDGKTYNMYEGSQIQRRIESAIRQEKDTQILARASGDNELVLQSQTRITQLTTKYKQLCNISGLPNKLSTRASVSGYKRTKISKDKDISIDKSKFISFDSSLAFDPFKDIDKEYFDFPINDATETYIKQSKDLFKKMEEDNKFRNEMYDIADQMEEVARPAQFDFIVYSGQQKDFDLTKNDFVLSTSLGKQTAKLYINGLKNGIVNEIYIEKGAKIISTRNSKRNQFDMQGEIIIPISGVKKMKMITEGVYLYKK